MNRLNVTALLVAAAGTALSLPTNALGAAKVVNISGATLSENYTKADASTNDFIDVDKNGTAGSLGSFAIQQLAPYDPTLAYTGASQIWVIQYRATGSVAGLQELIDFGRPNVDGTADGDAVGIETAGNGSISNAYHNRTQYISGGASSNPIFNALNPGGAPVRALNPAASTYASTTTQAAGTGVQIDITPLDVPAIYGVTKPGGSPAYDRKPLDLGYGLNPDSSRDKATGASTGASQQLATLTGGRNIDEPTNPNFVPNSDTIFDFPLAYVAIAALTNHGTGKTQITMTEQRYSLLTGRLPSGQNLTQATRESGSGTRNGFCNSVGLDPSYCRGDNVGLITAGGSPDSRLVGPGYSPTNKAGSGDLETVVRNTRIGIGYSGAERQKSTLQASRNEVLAVKNDIFPGAVEYSRPGLDEVLHNSIDGYRIGGFGVFASIGDPAGESIADGGDGNGNPTMSNSAAAAYLNNIRQSIANFTAFPNSPDNEFMPGEFGAKLFIFPSALDYANDDIADPTQWTAQAANANLVNAIVGGGFNALSDPGFLAYGTYSLNGQSPNRVSGSYSDGNLGGGFYVLNDGTTLSYNSTAINSRNRIAGDMNGDGFRDWLDAAELVKAAQWRAGGAAWNAPDGVWGAGSGLKASPEILADFNCDGNLNSADVRFWADGFALAPTGSNNAEGALSRVEGFTRVDNAAVAPVAGNFFSTTLANPSATYDAGDSRADVAGSTGTVPGWAPIGADGVVNAKDIDYVYANFGDWAVLADAVHIDLSCDMDGDLDVDSDDICTILSILETSIGDVNLSGTVDATDLGIATGNLGLAGLGFAGGDVDGDGVVTQADLDLISGIASGPCAVAPACVGDITGDGSTNALDFNVVASNFGAGPGATRSQGDLTGDGFVNALDFNILAGDFGCSN